MRKAVFKDFIRNIKGTLGRFFAIMAIVAIGVAFFAGVTASSGDMKHSSDSYYDEYNMNDIRILSSIGFTSQDIEAVSKVSGVKAVYKTNTHDVLVDYDGRENVAHISGIPVGKASDDDSYINQLRIKEGRLPQNDKECVVKYEDTRKSMQVGDVISFKSGTEDDINDTFKDTEYTVVGIVYTPCYVSYDLGSSGIGNGHINYCIYVGDDEFKNNYYTECYAVIDGAKDMDTYSDEYKKLIDKYADDIKAISKERLDIRKQTVIDEYTRAKADKKEELLETIKKNVVDSITEQYQAYYPGMDVSSMIAPYVKTAYEKAVAQFDFDAVNAEYDKKMNETLADSDSWEWYVLTRESSYSFRDYESSANRMKAIATVFPLFFIIVAGLVCLTTMTRMVEEERGLIGTYKALGYGKATIALKYVIYAFLASLTGAVIGCAAGLRLFPYIIYESWNIIYQMPAIKYASHTILSVVAVASLILVTLIATLYSCYNELSEVPSALMRPKAPKNGKKILLEHTFIWKHLSFSWKSTIRNLFRYKKRLIMTVFGIAGSMGLMLVGFGLQDSISDIAAIQYRELQHYDGMVIEDSDATEEEHEELFEYMKENEQIAHCNRVQMTKISAPKGSSNISIYLFVPESLSEFAKDVTLKNRITGETYELTDEGAAISEKTASLLGLKVGDMIPLKKGDKEYKVRVAVITENYMSHYLYMTPRVYEQTFGEKPEYENIVFTMQEDCKDDLEMAGTRILAYPGALSISYTSSLASQVDRMLSTLDAVILVLIVSAGMLAFVVLYNLNNINITERQRELATLKVLGFYDGEVSQYVLRENVILTVLGIMFGAVFGILIHRYVITTVEVDAVMFGRNIKLLSFLYSGILTSIFSIVVNGVMHFKLKTIDMVESLKSVE